MECKQFGWHNAAMALICISLLAGCNDLNEREASADGVVLTQGDFPWVVGMPTVPDSLGPEVPDGFSDPDGGPQIFGTPEPAQANEKFFFTPEVGGDPAEMDFSVQNLPSWADFDSGSGMISGTPSLADIGIHGGITISVSDGVNVSDLGPLEIQVLASGDRSVTIAWEPPTSYEDGTALTDLGGYTIRFGRAEGSYDTVVDLANPGLTSYAIDGLVAGTYFFATTAYDGSGTESAFSPVISGKIR